MQDDNFHQIPVSAAGEAAGWPCSSPGGTAQASLSLFSSWIFICVFSFIFFYILVFSFHYIKSLFLGYMMLHELID